MPVRVSALKGAVQGFQTAGHAEKDATRERLASSCHNSVRLLARGKASLQGEMLAFLPEFLAIGYADR